MNIVKAIPAEVEEAMSFRRNIVKMYHDNPCEISWKVLISSAIKDGTSIPQYLEELSQLAAFDEDTPVEDLQANLDQVRQALRYLIVEITDTNIYPELSDAFTPQAIERSKQ